MLHPKKRGEHSPPPLLVSLTEVAGKCWSSVFLCCCCCCLLILLLLFFKTSQGTGEGMVAKEKINGLRENGCGILSATSWALNSSDWD